jgi:hypothetical protein
MDPRKNDRSPSPNDRLTLSASRFDIAPDVDVVEAAVAPVVVVLLVVVPVPNVVELLLVKLNACTHPIGVIVGPPILISATITGQVLCIAILKTAE